MGPGSALQIPGASCGVQKSLKAATWLLSLCVYDAITHNKNYALLG